MKIHELEITAKQDRKRIGRGIGSGYGKTAGRGTKGQNSRSGGGVRDGFEGGQNPLAKRLPKKRGFASLSRVEYQTIGLDTLNGLKTGAVVTNTSLFEAKLVKSALKPVKILANGELSKKLTVQVQGATAAAQAAILQAGGTYTKTELAKSPKKPSKRNRTA